MLLIDSWRDQAALNQHHASPMMERIAVLREKYDLHMRAERYLPEGEEKSAQDEKFLCR